jgi:ketosteroid isomerase-like protein
MAPMSNEEVVRAYAAAHASGDHDRLTQLRHPDWITEWPQSGERIRGDANARAIDDAFPGGRPSVNTERIVGSEDRWVMTPVYSLQRIVGSGEAWWADGHITYSNGSTWNIILFVELRDGKIHRETAYFAEPFEAPAWRAPFVERMDQPR